MKTMDKIKLGVVIFLTFLILTVIPTGIYCAVEKESPSDIIGASFSSTNEKIVGKWQAEDGATAYEFYENGKFDSYLSIISYSGTYEVKGNKVTLTKSGSSNNVTYKASLSGDKLTLTLIAQNGNEMKEKPVSEYNRVERIDTKSFSELLNSIKDELNAK